MDKRKQPVRRGAVRVEVRERCGDLMAGTYGYASVYSPRTPMWAPSRSSARWLRPTWACTPPGCRSEPCAGAEPWIPRSRSPPCGPSPSLRTSTRPPRSSPPRPWRPSPTRSPAPRTSSARTRRRRCSPASPPAPTASRWSPPAPRRWRPCTPWAPPGSAWSIRRGSTPRSTTSAGPTTRPPDSTYGSPPPATSPAGRPSSGRASCTTGRPATSPRRRRPSSWEATASGPWGWWRTSKQPSGGPY